jgi:hypothetical protein
MLLSFAALRHEGAGMRSLWNSGINPDRRAPVYDKRQMQKA